MDAYKARAADLLRSGSDYAAPYLEQVPYVPSRLRFPIP